MKLLFIGDIVGKPGRRVLAQMLPGLRRELAVDLAIANGENSAGGFGITRETFEEIVAAGVDVVTGGNHTWQAREVFTLLDSDLRLLRPANYPPGTPGRGAGVFPLSGGRRGPSVGVLNMQGRIFLDPLESPFRVGQEQVERLRQETPVIVVDFHAEATSEKIALAWHLDGHVSAVLGTHTHVQTADERILPSGTGFITDVGMTGPRDSIIGMGREEVLQRFLTLLPARFDVAKGPAQLNAVLLDVDDRTGRARGIERVNRVEG
ncbi:MAG TPA: TIGR00282 family metallophosphoesterase [bacterium]|nr:TIGR00282 family metallophosphoesterase [bacterium]